MPPIKRVVLVHGAAHGAWCWEEIVPRLEALNLLVEALDLPGLGDDPTPPEQTSLPDYVGRVCEALARSPEPVLLVGHSMGGGVVTAAAEAMPEKVAKLVYVAAFVPADGETMGAAAARMADSPLAAARRPTASPDVHDYDRTIAAEVFYNRCAPATAAHAAARLRPQSSRPLTVAFQLSDRWAGLPKTYVLCRQDRAIPLDEQRFMAGRAPGMQVREMDADHSPFYSDPEGLTRILAEEAGVLSPI